MWSVQQKINIIRFFIFEWVCMCACFDVGSYIQYMCLSRCTKPSKYDAALQLRWRCLMVFAFGTFWKTWRFQNRKEINHKSLVTWTWFAGSCLVKAQQKTSLQVDSSSILNFRVCWCGGMAAAGDAKKNIVAKDHGLCMFCRNKKNP